MIQTINEIVYGDRSEKTGKIKVEVRHLDDTELGSNYLVIDWDITANNPDALFSKKVFWSNEKIDEVNTFLEANNDFSGMTKPQIERKKMQLALMLDTQTNLLPSGKTIYRLSAADWEFTPES